MSLLAAALGGVLLAQAQRPTLAYTQSRGCGDLLAYAQTADYSEQLLVRVKTVPIARSISETRLPSPASQLTSNSVTARVAPGVREYGVEQGTAEVRVELYGSGRATACTDVHWGPPAAVWKAVRGQVSVDFQNVDLPPCPTGMVCIFAGYAAEVTLTDVVFESAAGEQFSQSRPIIFKVFGGGTVGG